MPGRTTPAPRTLPVLWEAPEPPAPQARPAARTPSEAEAAFSALWRNRLPILCLLLLSLLAGLGLHLVQRPVFRATAQIELSAPGARAIEDIAPIAETPDLRLFQTAMEKLRSRATAERAVDMLALAGDAAFLADPSWFSMGAAVAAPAGDLEARRRMAVERVRQGLSVVLLRNTAILAVSFEDSEPERAARIANALAQSFIAGRASETAVASDVARSFLSAQAAGAAQRLEAAEQRLAAYAREQNMADAGSAGGSLVAQRMMVLNADLAKAVAAQLGTAAQVARIRAGEGEYLREVTESPALAEIRARTAALRAEYRQKLATFKPEFPAMRALRAEIGGYEAQTASITADLIRSVEAVHEEARLREEKLRGAIAVLSAEERDRQGKAVRYAILQREADAARQQHQNLIDKAEALGVGAALQRDDARVIDPARAPLVATGPGLLRSLAGSLLLGFCMAAAWVYARERLDRGFRLPAELEATTGLAVLGALPFTPPHRVEAALGEGASPLGESYRSLRGALQSAGLRGGPRVLSVTSAEPGEGKTTTALQIARDLSALGQRVLLMDCDLRRPALQRKLGLPADGGLGSILSGEVGRNALAGLFHPAAPNLWVLGAGPPQARAADLLCSARLGRLLDALAHRYDALVLDGPPVLGLADAAILARQADATLLVVAAGGPPRQAVSHALKRLREGGGHVLGAALTRFRPSRGAEARAYGRAHPDYGLSPSPAKVRRWTRPTAETLRGLVRP